MPKAASEWPRVFLFELNQGLRTTTPKRTNGPT
jgi:hypothetical protein